MSGAAKGNRTGRDRARALAAWLAGLSALWLLAGCAQLPSIPLPSLPSPFHHEPPKPGRTKLGSPLVTLPAQLIGNYLVIEVKWDRYGPYHFVIDTGQTVTFVTPALAQRYPSHELTPELPHVPVQSATGDVTIMPAAVMSRIELGDAHFDNVPVLVYDCAALSAHLGVQIDGILGFPLFRETQLTLDYPHARVQLRPVNTISLAPGGFVPFDDSNKTPLISIRIGDRTLVALVDTGSDAPLRLNPAGLDPKYLVPPHPGATVGTLTGDRAQQIGRLDGNLGIGDYTLPNPVVDLTDELTSIGGDILKNFTITFDQEHDRATFHRDTPDPVPVPPRRSAGLSFTKTPAYWRVASVVPDSPAESVDVEKGDLITKINGEPVAKWDLRRYEQLVATADEITFTFLLGVDENDKDVRVFEIVP